MNADLRVQGAFITHYGPPTGRAFTLIHWTINDEGYHFDAITASPQCPHNQLALLTPDEIAGGMVAPGLLEQRLALLNQRSSLRSSRGDPVEVSDDDEPPDLVLTSDSEPEDVDMASQCDDGSGSDDGDFDVADCGLEVPDLAWLLKCPAPPEQPELSSAAATASLSSSSTKKGPSTTVTAQGHHVCSKPAKCSESGSHHLCPKCNSAHYHSASVLVRHMRSCKGSVTAGKIQCEICHAYFNPKQKSAHNLQFHSSKVEQQAEVVTSLVEDLDSSSPSAPSSAHAVAQGPPPHSHWSLKVLQLNIGQGGIKAHKGKLERLLSVHRPDVVLFQETWLSAKDHLTKFFGYEVAARSDRKVGRSANLVRGGGVLILVRPGLKFDSLDPPLDSDDHTTDACGITLFAAKESFEFLNYYVPPIRRQAADQRQQFFNPHVITVGEHTIVGMDLNGHHGEWDDVAQEDDLGLDVFHWLSDHDYHVANTGLPTRYLNEHGTTPDITVTSATLAPKLGWTPLMMGLWTIALSSMQSL